MIGLCLRRLGALFAPQVLYIAPGTMPEARPEQVGLCSKRLARIDQAVRQHIAAQRVAGTVTLIARHGRIAHLSAHGKMDVESGEDMCADSIFRIYSMTKPLTSVALLMLYEQGKFHLLDPLSAYIPAFADVQVYAGQDDSGAMLLEKPRRAPTVHDIFRHTAGLTYSWFSETPVDTAYQEAGINYLKMPLNDLVNRIARMPLLYQPGTHWHYSYSHDVQAYLVEVLSGMPFAEFLRTRVLDPLSMHDTSFGLTPEKLARYTTNYGPSDNGGLNPIDKPADSNYLLAEQFPAGGVGLCSTAEDYLKFSLMMLNGGELNGERLLGRKTVQLMTMNHLPPEAMPIAAPGGGYRYGVGYGLGVSVMVDVAASGSIGSPGQFGWGGAASTSVIMDPVEQMVAIFMTQFMPVVVAELAQFQTLAYQAIID